MTWFTALGSTWVRWQLSRRNLFSVDVSEALAHGGRALIFLPSDPKQVPDALVAAKELTSWFDPVNVIWAGVGNIPPNITDADMSITSIPNAVNRWGLPYKPMIDRIKPLAPQVVIDLNPTFFQATAYLGIVSGATLRIGFRSPREGFFNLQYTWPQGDTESLPQHYEGFCRTLRQLRESISK
jgi:hypothetical protein